jgi:hypothetical protein
MDYTRASLEAVHLVAKAKHARIESRRLCAELRASIEQARDGQASGLLWFWIDVWRRQESVARRAMTFAADVLRNYDDAAADAAAPRGHVVALPDSMLGQLALAAVGGES